jgi:hypothetical protein
MKNVEVKEYLDFINMRIEHDKEIIRRLVENENKFWNYGYGNTFSILSSLIEERDAN